MNRRLLLFTAMMTAVCPWNSTAAQGANEMHVAVVPSLVHPPAPLHERLVMADTDEAKTKAPSLVKHTAYGAAAGLVVRIGYYRMTCDGSCRAEGTRGQQLLMLPVVVGIGASAGFVVGLLRRAQ